MAQNLNATHDAQSAKCKPCLCVCLFEPTTCNIFITKRACKGRRKAEYPPLRRLRFETQQNITMSSQFLGEFCAVLQRAADVLRFEAECSQRTNNCLLKASAKRTVFLTWARSTLAILFHFISLYIYRVLWTMSWVTSKARATSPPLRLHWARSCTKIERPCVHTYIFYFALSTPNCIKRRLLAHAPSSRFQHARLKRRSNFSVKAQFNFMEMQKIYSLTSLFDLFIGTWHGAFRILH